MLHAPYTADKALRTESADELRARIPGWGADLDPKDRPSVPRERFEPTGAHWGFPERQEEKWPRERSIEHEFLTPVFGTRHRRGESPGPCGSSRTPGTAKDAPPTG